MNSAEITRADQAKTSFISEISHDLRTPMCAIIGFAEIAGSQPNNPEKTKECLEKIKTVSGHMMSLINEVLDISRIESGKIILRRRNVSISEMLEEILTVIKPQAAAGGLDFTLIKGQICPDEVITDSVRLKQICLNLLSNAVKYTPRGGKVEFFFSAEPAENTKAELHIKVRDNGIGMSTDFLKKLFMPFEREQRSDATGIQGTGLGMAITKKLVDLMHGNIMVESRPYSGTCFTLIIPADLPENSSAEASSELQSETTDNVTKDLSHMRILLAEDNELNREIATELIGASGAHIETAKNGKEAVELFNSSEPFCYDIILMDIQMPVMNGLEAARTIRSLKRADAAEIPILAMSANAFTEDIKRSLAAGMNAHLSKPLDIDRLFAAMELLRRKGPMTL